MATVKKKTALVCLSQNGANLGLKLIRALESSTLYVPETIHCTDLASPHVQFYKKTIKSLIPTIFSKYHNIIFIMATGIVVRMIGKLAQDKKKDPAVVVVDERGKFAISLLSGHLGGANILAEKVAEHTDGQAVITTASDVHKKPAIDTIAQTLGYHIENPSGVARFTRAFLDGEKVAIIDTLGQVRKEYEKEKNVRFFRSLETLPQFIHTAIIVTNKTIEHTPSVLLIRPKNIVVGIGCRRGVSEKEVREAIGEGFSKAGVSLNSLLRVVTIDLKNDEKGLIKHVERHQIPIHFYSKEEINRRGKRLKSGSKKVLSLIGVPGVCEICAKLNTRRRTLLLNKIKIGKRVTIALAEAISP